MADDPSENLRDLMRNRSTRASTRRGTLSAEADPQGGDLRGQIASAAWLVFTVAGTAVLAWALPAVVAIGSCSSTGQLSGGNRDVALCTDAQVNSIIGLFAGLGVFFLGFFCTFRLVRGRDAIVSRLLGGGITALVAGVLAELKLREPEVIASMPSADLAGWKIGLLPLVIGGPVCLVAAVIIVVVRQRSQR